MEGCPAQSLLLELTHSSGCISARIYTLCIHPTFRCTSSVGFFGFLSPVLKPCLPDASHWHLHLCLLLQITRCNGYSFNNQTLRLCSFATPAFERFKLNLRPQPFLHWSYALAQQMMPESAFIESARRYKQSLSQQARSLAVLLSVLSHPCLSEQLPLTPACCVPGTWQGQSRERHLGPKSIPHALLQRPPSFFGPLLLCHSSATALPATKSSTLGSAALREVAAVVRFSKNSSCVGLRASGGRVQRQGYGSRKQQQGAAARHREQDWVETGPEPQAESEAVPALR